MSTKIPPPPPVKPRLDFAIRRIELQMQRLDNANERFTERDKSIFVRVVEAYSKHDMPRANVFANELAEIRKMEKMIMQTRLALEQAVLRLKGASESGEVVSAIAPIIGVLRSTRLEMASIFPEAERELGQIGHLLYGIIIDTAQSSGQKINFEDANKDTEKILTDSATLADKKMKEKLPDIPTGISGSCETCQSEGKSTE